MSASADLYALATYWGRRAERAEHQPDPADPWGRCSRECWRCYLQAKASLHERAGDAAKALEDQGS